ncbi:MAG: hypothetical protein FWH14_08440 [Oscillospiraceae bacterium]|nr:hypothetical protein [Oscillospiraceae bacterium]
MANTRNKVAIVFDGVVCPEMPSQSCYDGRYAQGRWTIDNEQCTMDSYGGLKL